VYFTTPGAGQWLEAILRARLIRARELGERGDRGASAVEWVVITSILIVIVGAVGTLIYQKLQTAASSLNVNPNVGGGNP